ncbi:Heat stress transcription factor A-1 [Morus notabilis]|uniref:Heat stress transcription factor A-1 n=1 Tax=Morus notabilis TaxID=981085 RepID=W9QMH2_9ROSA|nr:Heat stress transcription factor A-1 [Morus notabilis]
MLHSELQPGPTETHKATKDLSVSIVQQWQAPVSDVLKLNVDPSVTEHGYFAGVVGLGFKKVDPDRWEFANEGFLRGQKHLLKTINRRKTTQTQNGQQAQAPSSKVGACVEVGNFGLEEEVDRLKRDKNVLMQELVRLRQQQQGTDHQLQNVGQRVQVMEQRQQQMMSFLAKAMHRPGFLAQFVQQKNESSRHISGGNKKRRLPRQEEENLASEHWINAPDGQIVKFQPSMNEAAKAMFRQILKMNASPRREASLNNPDAFLIDNVPSANALDSESAYSRFSEVIPSEVPQNSGKSFAQGESGFPANFPSKAISEIQSSPRVVSNYVQAAQFSEAKLQSSQEERVMPDFVQTHEPQPQSTEELPGESFVNTGTSNAECMDMSGVLDAEMVTETDPSFSSPCDADIGPDGVHKLPAINDSFWEQFFLGDDTDETNSSSVDGGMTQDEDFQLGQENGWDHLQHMSNITEGIGLLASECRRG